MRTTFISILFTVLLIQQNALAQENPYVFSHLKERDGLSHNSVYCFLKDSRDIFWIGTQNGLNRFDGSNFYTYKVKRNGNSIPDAFIMSLCEDKKGNIWGGTNNGIFCFNPGENKFVNYFPLDSKRSNTFLNILCDKKGNIWAGGWITLLKFDSSKNSFKEILHLNNDSAVQYSMRKNCLMLDPLENGFWMATRSGMFYYDINKNKLLSPGSEKGNPLFARGSVAALAKSPKGHYWYFNNATKEITAFDPTKKSILFKINIKEQMPEGFGGTLHEDRQGRLWLGTWNSETFVVDYKENKIANITLHKDDPLSISNGFFWDVLEDDDATLWFATINGLSKCNPDKNIYKPYRLPETISILKNTAITIVKEDPFDNSFWIMTSDRHLIHYWKQNGSYEVFDLSRSKPDKKGNMIGDAYLIKPFKNYLAICTINGLWQLPKGKKQIEPLEIVAPSHADFKAAFFASLGDSVFYLSDGKKILYLNRMSGKTDVFGFSPDTLADGSIPGTSIAGFMKFDNKNELWVYAGNGWIARLHDRKLQPILVAKDDAGKSIGYFNSMEPDNAGNIWLANELTGLYCYNIATQKIRKWDEADGINISSANNTVADKYGQVWCIRMNKVSVLLDSANGVYNMTLPMGESTPSYYNSSENLLNGNVIASIHNDLVEFRSQQVHLSPARIKPQISLINISGKDHLVMDEKSLILKPDQNSLRFRFGIFTDKEVFPYDMEYLLDDAEKTWIKAVGNNEATYNNLAPGKYTFRVKAKGKNNGWESDEVSFQIIIKAPFYKTSWFLIAIALLTIGSLVFLYRYRLAQKEKVLMLEGKAQRLEKEKVMVMYESLKQQLNPHFLFNSLTSLSGLIETDQQVAGNFLEQMSGIYRYILKNGDNETVSLKDEIEFVQLYINLQQTRFKKGLQVNINVPDEYLHYKIAPVTLQNLIENAIKHNIIDSSSPLVIDIFIDGAYLVVKNNLQKKRVVETSNKKGLEQFVTLYKYMSRLPVGITETDKNFQIKIPLL